MIEYDLFIKLVIVWYIIGGLSHIYLSSTKEKKDTHYGPKNLVSGVLLFLFAILFLIL
jgi:hypothetical protein